MIAAADLNKQFHVAGVDFVESAGLTGVRVRTPAAEALVWLQGAHLVHWQPHGFEPVIWLSSRSEFGPGKAIRGGVPIVFPWFSRDTKQDRVDGHPGPTHGFARISEWSLMAVFQDGENVHLSLMLMPNALSRSMGFAAFMLQLDMVIGSELRMMMKVTNQGKQPLAFEEGFHTYLRVADVHEAKVTGLEGADYVDKSGKNAVMPAEHAPIQFGHVVDRVYNHVTTPATVEDTAGRRRILIEKAGAKSTVVWNPQAPLADVDEWDWHNFVACETANVGADALVLAPGADAVMAQHIRVVRDGV